MTARLRRRILLTALRALSIGDNGNPTNLVSMTPGPFLNALSQRAFWLARSRLHGAHVLFYERDKCACFGAGEAARWVNGG